MPRKQTSDVVLEAELERAMQPYRSVLPPEMQDVFEDILVHALTEHPVGKVLLDRVRLRPALVESAEQGTWGSEVETQPLLDARSFDGEPVSAVCEVGKPRSKPQGSR